MFPSSPSKKEPSRGFQFAKQNSAWSVGGLTTKYGLSPARSLSRSTLLSPLSNLIKTLKPQDIKNLLLKLGQKDPLVKQLLLESLDPDLLNMLCQKVVHRRTEAGLQSAIEPATDSAGKSYQPIVVVVSGTLNIVIPTHQQSELPSQPSVPQSKGTWMRIAIARMLYKILDKECPKKTKLVTAFQAGSDVGLLTRLYSPSKNRI